jgi:hypothetical protein
MSTFDAILVPGGGVREGGELPLWVKKRFDKAIEICQGESIIPLSAGTPHKPALLDERGFPLFESVAGANYLIHNGITSEKILIESSSYDTIGNAYFSRVIHAEPRKFKKLLVITSEFHMPRTERVFTWIYSLPPLPFEFELEFIAVSDEGMDETSLSARNLAEKVSLERLAITIQRIHDLQELHRWLFSEHDAYRAGGWRSQRSTSDDLMKTY